MSVAPTSRAPATNSHTSGASLMTVPAVVLRRVSRT